MAAEHVRGETRAFHLFPWFPRELRDVIWRACLPHRVVEIDIPLGSVAMGVWLLGDHSDYSGQDSGDEECNTHDVDRKGRGCHMARTTRINSAPPIISRVCRESRMVAFETGRLLRHEHRKACEGPDIRPHVDQQWFDPARDAVHLHYTIYLLPDRGVRVEGNPMRILHERVAGQRVRASLAYDYISCGGHRDIEWLESMALLEDLGEISVCLKVVCIHIDEGPAVQSGLFGTLGEERVVLVDALDHKHISKFCMVWQAHGSCYDPLTEAFFKQYVNDDSAIIEEDGIMTTVRDAVTEMQVEWLLNRWHALQAETPGLVPENIWENDPAALPDDRYIPTRLKWVPNRRHLWVEETYLQMPRFRPTIMFRLCIGRCPDMPGSY